MRDKQTREIDGITYVIYPMDPFKASALLTRILKIIGPSIGKVMEGAKGGNAPSMSDLMDKKVDASFLGVAIEELVKNLDDKEVIKVMRDLLSSEITYSEDGEKFSKLGPMPDSHFNKQGILHLFKTVKFAAEVNYSDFLDGSVGASA